MPSSSRPTTPTPAPWEVEKQFIVAERHGEDAIIADVDWLENTDAARREQAGNANLIAAAPKLLAALKALTAEFATYLPDDRNSEALDDAVAAIAEAEGWS